MREQQKFEAPFWSSDLRDGLLVTMTLRTTGICFPSDRALEKKPAPFLSSDLRDDSLVDDDPTNNWHLRPFELRFGKETGSVFE